VILRRLPIRLKLTLAFTGVMAVLLAAAGLFLYLRLSAQLDHTLAQSLRSRSGDVSALVQQADTGLRDATRTNAGEVGAAPAQILDSSGRVFDATPGLQKRPLLTAAELRSAKAGSSFFDRAHGAGASEPVRLLATPVHAQGRSLVAVVGASLEDRNQALANLGALLLIGGPVALLLAALAGYGLATAALRPVESMRARAADISTDDLDRRLPLSPSRDELHRLGATLNAMLARLEAGLARERAFVADASHELRTPLAMLRTELELIGRDRPQGEQLNAAVDSAIEETGRLGRLTEDLLVLARADQDRIPIEPETVRVADLLSAVGRRYAGLEIDRRAAVTDLQVHADRTRLEQALTNMVDNALHYGGAPIRLTALERHGFVELHVTDAGPGFAPEFLPRAFERFTRADASRTTHGTGLGLAIVQAIAHAHGGSAQAANLAGGGADVWVAIPTCNPADTRHSPVFGGSALAPAGLPFSSATRRSRVGERSRHATGPFGGLRKRLPRRTT
jgi:two-component system, OmpR family, sensor kinase